MWTKIRKIVRGIRQGVSNTSQMLVLEKANFSHQLLRDLLQCQPDSLLKYGFSAYSQNDEDGIIAEIFQRLEIPAVRFVEYGVAVTENNTLNLLGNGKGAWVDKSVQPSDIRGMEKRLLLVNEFVTRENIAEIQNRALEFLGIGDPADLDFLSLDLDGNDYYLVETLLEQGHRPKVFCLEYNARFPPPRKMKIRYNPDHRWNFDDFFGCSLQEYIDLLSRHDYTLVVCNLTGVNCFFVRNQWADRFTLYPPGDVYQPPRYFLCPMYKGHPSSLGFFKDSGD